MSRPAHAPDCGSQRQHVPGPILPQASSRRSLSGCSRTHAMILYAFELMCNQKTESFSVLVGAPGGKTTFLPWQNA